MGSLRGALHEEDDGGGGDGLVDGLAGRIGQEAVLEEEDGAEGSLGRNGRPGGGGEELLLLPGDVSDGTGPEAQTGALLTLEKRDLVNILKRIGAELVTGTRRFVRRKRQTDGKITARRTDGELSAAAAVETVITTF